MPRDRRGTSLEDAFPTPADAPRSLLTLPGGCGPLAAWLVLRHFGRRVAARRVVEACRYTAEHGTFTIGLALGLRELGLRVRFHSEPDPEPPALEEACYAAAKEAGVEVGGALELAALLDEVGRDCVGVVLYDADGAEAHLSPLLGSDGRHLVLATAATEIDSAEFDAAWRAPGILRQCVLVSQAGR